MMTLLNWNQPPFPYIAFILLIYILSWFYREFKSDKKNLHLQNNIIPLMIASD